eukprot:gnl/Hemi2/12318_TR4214_c1_g11_i1.p3 gnl/Hemi2/12318_TR4214_c1_g11~~gnl/Hemi2/12318_TR4214_c1_g11_i1.p3  ORF type:complete len:128 (-),score=4.25 gnl/Hemi2/12318_TR4214_c1_g11_i1:1404-1787(-)
MFKILAAYSPLLLLLVVHGRMQGRLRVADLTASPKKQLLLDGRFQTWPSQRRRRQMFTRKMAPSQHEGPLPFHRRHHCAQSIRLVGSVASYLFLLGSRAFSAVFGHVPNIPSSHCPPRTQACSSNST